MTAIESPPRNAEWFLPMQPYPFQWDAYFKTADYIRTSSEPGYLYCSVSAGKSLMMAMIAKRAQQMAEDQNKKQLMILCIARTGELVEQNAEQMWEIGVRNSIFSASVGIKSTKYPVIVGSEGTICRALHTELKNIVFDIILWDENHTVPADDEESQAMKIIAVFKERNPKLKVIGYTGSPFRGVQPIKGSYWKNEIYRMDMWDLVNLGFVVPPIFGFGHDDIKYQLDDIKPSGIDGTDDFSKEQLNEMQKRILADGTTTQKIMLEVIGLAKTRNCVLITCAGSKHIKECIQALPEGSYATITEKTTFKDRRAIKEGCNSGRIKYVLQIGCWTTGVNIPPIDTIVILRKIGSLTLLTQLIGRGIRNLKPAHIALGMVKTDCLVLDYSETMESLGEMFNDPMLESAQLQKAKKEHDLIECSRCNTMNSKFARRCMGKDLSPRPIGKLAPDPRGKVYIHQHTQLRIKEPDGRCGFFWSEKKCEACGTPNDKVARSCRRCDAVLIDPNDKLTGKHYTDDDYKPVLGFNMTLTKDRKGLLIFYQLPENETAKEVFFPTSDSPVARKIFYDKFISKHLHASWHNRMRGKNAIQILAMKASFDVPSKITHRINEKGNSVIHRKVFLSGREVIDQ